MDALLNRPLNYGLSAKRERFAVENSSSRVKKASASHLSCTRRIYRVRRGLLQSVVGAEATPEGRVLILAASTEIGQGTNTIFSQIAAEALGLDYDLIEVTQPDTGNVPNSGPTVASRTCMIVGKLVESAVLGLKQTLIASGHLREGYSSRISKSMRRIHQSHGPLKSMQIPAASECLRTTRRSRRRLCTYAWAVTGGSQRCISPRSSREGFRGGAGS